MDKLIRTNIQPNSPVIGSRQVTASDAQGSFAKVYFTKHIDAEHLIALYKHVNEAVFGKVAIKLHTGERHGPNILPRDLVKAFQAQIPTSTIVETNTLYKGDCIVPRVRTANPRPPDVNPRAERLSSALPISVVRP